MLFKKSYLGWFLITFLSLSPLIPWVLVQPFNVRFMDAYNTYRSVAEISGLVGVSMFSLSLVLSTRMKFLENFFGGMNRVYVAHHIFGSIALLILLVHPLASAATKTTYSLKSAALYLLPGEDWTVNLGIAAFYLMMALLILTIFVSLRYQIWRFTHKFLGLAFFIGVVHGLFVSSDISTFTPMRIYMLIFFLLGLAAYTYKTLLGRFLIRKYSYTVTEIKTLEDNVLEIKLTPEKKSMSYLPGQFVFLSFQGTGVSNETHPFSISSPNTGSVVQFTIKAEGDYTNNLKNLKVGDKAFLEGSFGRFLYDKAKNKKQVWVAGGIGITPFLSMAQSLKPDFIADLYYSVRTQEEAVHLNDFLQIAGINRNFRVFPFYTKTQGRLTAEIISQTSGDILSRDIFICGPPPMMKSLRKQFRSLHVPNDLIHTEEFNLL